MKLHKSTKKRVLRVLIALCVLIPVSAGASIAWNHLRNRPCTQVRLHGVQYTDRAVLKALISDTMDAQIVADRLRRHPWVRSSRAACYVTGTLNVWIDERVPRALVLTPGEAPDYYVDRVGFMMPLDALIAFDVPVVHGVSEPYRPLKPVEDPGMRTLLALLPNLDASTDSLISELVFDGSELVVITCPTPAGPVARVHLGRNEWHKRLTWLNAFWKQQILAHPYRRYERIDLRFEGQIITEEKPA